MAKPDSPIGEGDRVEDLDAGLAHLRAIMSEYGHTPKPNHHGTVEKIEGATAYVNYDDGTYAPCPLAQLRKLT